MWRWGLLGAAGLFAVWIFRSETRDDESSLPSAVAETERRGSPIDDATVANVKPDEPENGPRPSSREEKTFANWSTYHSKQGGFSVFMPDHREEKQHIRIESLGVDGPAVQAQFVQLPNTSEPIESWPAIGQIWLRAIWLESSNPDFLSPAGRIPAGATEVLVADLPGTEFVVKRGNETQKVRLFVQGDRTIVLTAIFVGREWGDDGAPFGEGVNRFLGSLQLDSPGVNETAGEDSFEIVERYVRELAGNELSEDLIRTRLTDLKAAAAKAHVSPEAVLTLLRNAKAEAEATGAGPVFVIRTVLATLDFKAAVKGNR